MNNLMIKGWRRIRVGISALLCLSLFALPGATLTLAQQKEKTENRMTAAESERAINAFKVQVKQYAKLRDKLEGKLPKLSPEAKPAEIEAYQVSFGNLLQGARAEAKPGDVFTPEVARHFRQVIREEFTGERLKELRGTVLNSDAKTVPLRISYVYPETKEMIEMPPVLLLRLPELPKQLRYRFAGRSLLLVDGESLLIVDYMLNALP